MCLTDNECYFLDLFFILCPHWKKIIFDQIYSSEICREITYSNYAVCFKPNKKTSPISSTSKMPVEIILGNVEFMPNCEVKRINNCQVIKPCTLNVPDIDAMGVRLYFSEGFIVELEVYSLSGKKICTEIPKCKQKTYIVFEDNMMNFKTI